MRRACEKKQRLAKPRRQSTRLRSLEVTPEHTRADIERPGIGGRQPDQPSRSLQGRRRGGGIRKDEPTTEGPEAAPAETPSPAAIVAQSAELREENLDRALERLVAEGGRIKARSPFQAVIAKGSAVHKTRHLILTIMTIGLWAIVWILLPIFGGIKRRVITVNEHGNITAEKI